MSTENQILLQLRNIGKSFGTTRALDSVDMDIYEGEIHAILGQNGAGKSTLVKILDNVHTDFEGSIIYRGEVIPRKEMSHLLTQKLGVVHQEFPLIPYLTVAENIFLSKMPESKGKVINWKKLFSQTDELLQSLDISIDPRMKILDLTMAERQLVTIARAISRKPEVVIFDEATSALTESEVNTISNILKSLLMQRVAVIFISHKIEEILNISDRVTVLRDGHSVETKLTSETNKFELINMMAGKDVQNQFPARISYEGSHEIVLEAKDLCGENFFGCNLQIRKGEILGIAGLVGAGRPELIRTLFGAIPIKSGSVFLRGKRIDILKPSSAIKENIYFIPSDRRKEGILSELSIRDNVTIGLLGNFCKFGKINHTKESKVTNEYIEKLNIKTTGESQKIKELSGGNQQKVVIARWLSGSGEVFLFDEPTRGLDVGVKYDVYELMNQIKANGNALVMISSELPELLAMSDRVLVMFEGMIVAEMDNTNLDQATVLTAMMNQS